jgi:hypothetical protein
MKIKNDFFKMVNFKFTIAAAAITLVASGNCLAQLGGEAPLPEIKKPTGPSLEETTQWITAKFASTIPFNVGYGGKKYEEATFDGCEMAFIETEPTQTEPSDGSAGILYFYRLKLQEMDGDNITIQNSKVGQVEYPSLHWHSLGRKDVIKISRMDPVALTDKELIQRLTIKDDDINNRVLITINGQQIESIRYDVGLIIIPLRDVEVAERMSSALKHAVMLCQKKAADEKAARPAKPKELF